MKRLMGHKNWKRKNEAVNLTNISENEIVQSGQHMRLLHSTEEQQILSSQVRNTIFISITLIGFQCTIPVQCQSMFVVFRVYI